MMMMMATMFETMHASHDGDEELFAMSLGWNALLLSTKFEVAIGGVTKTTLIDLIVSSSMTLYRSSTFS